MGIFKNDPIQGEKKVLPKKPKNNQSNHLESDFSDELFANYNITPDWEEALWTATNPEPGILSTPEVGMLNTTEHPLSFGGGDITQGKDLVTPDHVMTDAAEPMMVEEDVWNIDVDVDVSNDTIVPQDANVIAVVKNETEKLNDCWGFNSFHAPPSMVEGILDLESVNYGSDPVAQKPYELHLPDEVESIYNMDLVQFAIGESGLEGLLDSKEEIDMSIVKTEDEPVATTSSFIHASDNSITTIQDTASFTLTKIGREFNSKITKKSALKRRPGRPERKTPILITEVPKQGSVMLTDDQMKSLKYRRARDLNNEASKRCRQNRKEKQQEKERECEELAERNRELKQMLLAKEEEMEAWKAKCRLVGYPC